MTSASTRNDKQKMVCVGKITAAHGVRGFVKVESYTETACDFASFGALYDATGTREFRVEIVGRQKDRFLVRVNGIADKNQADGLRGTKLYVPRGALPETAQDEFYHADLIGMRVATPAGKNIGTVKAIFNFGAGDVLEIEKSDEKETEYLAFSKQNVPVVDVENRFIVADFPKSVTVRPSAAKEKADAFV